MSLRRRECRNLGNWEREVKCSRREPSACKPAYLGCLGRWAVHVSSRGETTPSDPGGLTVSTLQGVFIARLARLYCDVSTARGQAASASSPLLAESPGNAHDSSGACGLSCCGGVARWGRGRVVWRAVIAGRSLVPFRGRLGMAGVPLKFRCYQCNQLLGVSRKRRWGLSSLAPNAGLTSSCPTPRNSSRVPMPR